MTRMMKDSGIEWIGEIPENWSIQKYKNFASSKMGETILASDTVEEGIPVYSATQDEKVFGFVKTSNTLLHKNDIVIPARGNSIGCATIVKDDVATCTQTTICSRNIHNISTSYLYYCCWGLKEWWFNYDGSAIPQITVKQVNNNLLPVPTLSEQQKIAAFLDEKCGAIDEIISKTEQSIEEYKKLKQSVITKAVTKGIRPNRPMQDSNIEWIGEIPTDWKIKRFRYIADKFLKGSGITKDDVKEDGNIKCVRYGEIYSKYNYTFNDCLSCTNVEEISTPQYFSYGDLLFAGTGELIEEIGKSIVYLGNDKCLAGGDIIVVKHRHNPAFLNYTLNSDVAIYQKSRNKIKLKVVHISAAEIKNIIVPLPPLDEQKEIADYLDEKCSEIDTLIEKKQQFLAEMANYKKSLIYEYVTGKKEVA